MDTVNTVNESDDDIYSTILMECKCCHQLFNKLGFPPSSRASGRFLCRACLRERVGRSRGSNNFAKRLLANLRQRCSYKAQVENRVSWTLENVEELICQWNSPPKLDKMNIHKDKNVRIKVIPIDKQRPLAPGNAKIVCYVL